MHELVERLKPEQAGEVRAHLLRLVRPDGPGDGLAEILREEARNR